jgi:hypothetical protein
MWLLPFEVWTRDVNEYLNTQYYSNTKFDIRIFDFYRRVVFTILDSSGGE